MGYLSSSKGQALTLQFIIVTKPLFVEGRKAFLLMNPLLTCRVLNHSKLPIAGGDGCVEFKESSQ